MAEIVTFGELLAEFVATRVGHTFDSPGTFEGPFASGAPAIFADQAARQGVRVAIAGWVGQDAFGDAVLRRLEDDGVSVKSIARSKDRPTGTAFVAYRADGNRQFVFNIAQSAAGLLNADGITPELFDGCRWLHVMGSSLYSQGAIAAARAAIEQARQHGCRISFDPNIRSELTGSAHMQQALWETLKSCHLFLPSEADLQFFYPDLAPSGAIRKFLERPSLEAVVLKRGSAGSIYVDRNRRIDKPAFEVAEIDPTGAGDCFCGTFLACLVRGLPVEQALMRANAAGAMAVLKRGPMEGNNSKEELDQFIAGRSAGPPRMT
ncbi:MAG TPA: sugar kinase [Terriglobia bacterium]|nr:sugar kinase [Terriglobia bacterium]